MKPSRNNPCPCGSGKKYKHCCEREIDTNLKLKTAATPSQVGRAAQTANELNRLLALFDAQQFEELESQAQSLLATHPNTPFAWQLLGGALQMQGKDGLSAFKKCAELSPNDINAHFNLGIAYKRSQQYERAVASYRYALALNPNYFQALSNLGNLLQEIGRFEEAVTYYQQALVIQPSSAATQKNLDYTLQLLGNTNHTPTRSELNQIVALVEAGKLIEAEYQLRLLTDRFPDSGIAYKFLGICLNKQGKAEDALAIFSKAGTLLPNDAEVFYNFGIAYTTLGEFNSASENYRQALKLNPNLAEAYNNLATAMLSLGKVSESISILREALERKPDYARANSNLLFALNHSEATTAQELYAEHLQFAERFEVPLKANWSPHNNFRDPERRLQVGFVSSDLCNHAVASFLEAVLRHLAKFQQLSLHAYYNNTTEDAVTQRLKGYFSHWHEVSRLTDEALAQKIRLDGIDILYDLSGHMANNRILTFARKPAPIQVSWIAYPCTTGLSSMDYYQADRFLFPDNQLDLQLDLQLTEKIVRLPASSTFSPIQDAPCVSELPALNNGYITFGSFNRISKINGSTVATWSQLLHALPDSKMLLGAMPKNGQYQIVINWFEQNGINENRLIFHPHVNSNHYLCLHHQVDICLDTFPYNGETTTCNALWMGVPTLTLSGQTLASRVGASILGHVGLASFTANNKTDFVQNGLRIANNLAELSKIRSELRVRITQSAKGQPEVVAASMAKTLRLMWQRWCAKLPAEPFDV